MALGDTYNNNKGNNTYQPTVYSAYKLNNAESTVDPTSISFTFWKSMLKISIAPKKPGAEIAFDFDNAAVIYLNHTKARMLEIEIDNFLKDPTAFTGCGVPSGQGLITISNGLEYGIDCPCLTIRKINGDTGVVESSYVYQIKQNYYYSVRNYSEKDGSFEKATEDFNLMELEQLKTLLVQYYTAMTNATAYTVIDQSKYDNSRTNTKLDAIADALGVKSKGSGNKSSGSYFNNNSGAASTPAANLPYNKASVDDIEDKFE